VNLVGEFSDWDTTATPMLQTRADANWLVTVDLNSGLRYRFKYLLAGQEWLNDWKADGFFWPWISSAVRAARSSDLPHGCYTGLV
jgi:1,4-alpha-glucan branching enzyme